MFQTITTVQAADCHVMFVTSYAEGMVGEEMCEVKAYRMGDSRNFAGRPTIDEELTYDQLKQMYARLEGKDERIAFHRQLRTLSPEAKQRRLASTDAEIELICR
jgi:hypothetical protein